MQGKDGKAVITGLRPQSRQCGDSCTGKDKNGRILQVSTVDLFYVADMYKTRIVVLEQGHNRDLRLCFFGFKQLSEVYIPNSIMKIGEKAFNPKTSPKFNMPSTIRESDLLAGNVIYTKAGISNNSDPLARD